MAAYKFHKFTKKIHTQFKKISYKLGMMQQQQKLKKKELKKNTLETLGQSDDNVRHGML